MPGLLVLCMVAFASASPQYNYPHQVQQQFISPPSPTPIQHSAPVAVQPNSAYAVIPLPASSKQVGMVEGAITAQHQVHQHPQPTSLVSKHIYVHSAPEESPEVAQSQSLGGGLVHKNYRIVFIKAPTDSGRAAALSLAQGQNEEKTIIYDLTKKTDAADLLSQIAETKNSVSKPEVFFIKYKTPEEAEHAQHTIQAQYDALGGTAQISDEGVAPVQSFIGSLGNGNGIGQAAESQGAATLLGPTSSNLLNQGYLPPSF